jgi:hypothetical protein
MDNSIACSTTRCECLAKLQPHIVFIHGATYEQNDPLIPTLDLTMQIIEFTFIHHRCIGHAMQTKETKYNPLKAQSQKTRPLTTITPGVRGAPHTRSIEFLKKL